MSGVFTSLFCKYALTCMHSGLKRSFTECSVLSNTNESFFCGFSDLELVALRGFKNSDNYLHDKLITTGCQKQIKLLTAQLSMPKLQI